MSRFLEGKLAAELQRAIGSVGGCDRADGLGIGDGGGGIIMWTIRYCD
jgi:hypothetical protein